METMPLDRETAHHGGDVCVMCVSLAKILQMRVNLCNKCYSDPEAKKMREEKKAARSKCTIDRCGGIEVRSYGLCGKHYKKSVEEVKAKMKVATDGNFAI